MAAIKIIFFIIATAMAVTLILTTTTHRDNEPTQPFDHPLPTPTPKRVSRFLQQNKERNPRAADHCHKDHEICSYIMGGRNTTCCNNKCVDLGYDNKNCGACKNKCDFTETCCNGECVTLAFDKRHCGACHNKCMPGGYCIYGMCDYA